MFNNSNPNRPKYTNKEALQVLELNKHASIDDIRRQFKSLARRYHPDISKITDKQWAHLKFIQINEAYSILNESHIKSKTVLVNKIFQNAYSKYNSERKTLLTKEECRNFILTKFIGKIEASEGIKFNISPSIISCAYEKGFYLIRPSSFRSIVYIIKKKYIKKFGIERYNLFYNSFTHRLDSYVDYYRKSNNNTMAVIHKNLLVQWERINVAPFNFDFSNAFTFENLRSVVTNKRGARKSWKTNLHFKQGQKEKEHKLLPNGIFRFNFIRNVSKKMKKKVSNLFDVLNISSSLSKIFVQKNNWVNRFKKR